ncbi:hypothetical protein G3578_09780 [Brevibacillus sp. SYP-B805]|uniref:hypothetical protein n=1 Tax=Brevibacillus sp. SYP-B805 TaxID=1578199 RepID=UPI0013EDC2E5|nr:hypothetical protein [Brevibacillus sp. SYP-B805]NGQ95442.1 hypothetical protein [Brevibacillus sp. SYP-B805]
MTDFMLDCPKSGEPCYCTKECSAIASRRIDKRDLLHDLSICNAATPGPLNTDGYEVFTEYVDTTLDDALIARFKSDDDAIFFAEARTGWPHAIERALKAENERDLAFNMYVVADENCKRLESEVDRLRGVLEYFAVSPIFRFVESPHSLRQMAQMALRKEATADDQ